MSRPRRVDLWPALDKIRNQGKYGACTGYDGAEHLGEFYFRAGYPVTLSAMFVWWMEKLLSGVTGNVGVSSAMIPRVLEQYGTCLESSMPDTTTMDAAPTAVAIAEALNYRISSSSSYSRLGTWEATLERIKDTIAKGAPVSATMFVYPGFYTLKGPWESHWWDTTPNPLSPPTEAHQVEFVGYDDASGRVLGRNHWTDQWGDGGFFGVPYEFFTNPGINPFIVFIEMVPASVTIINAGWRPDLTPLQLAVQQAYIAYFGRPADLPGLNYWANVAATNPISTILNGFASSAESRALYPGQTPEAVIAAVYAQLFGRAPEAAGLAFWSGVVTSGKVSIGECIYDILQGAQGTDRAAVSAKVEAASVLTYSANGYVTATIPAARAWLAGILTQDHVQPAVQALPC